MTCDLYRSGPNLVCRRCGRPYPSNAEPHKARRTCRAPAARLRQPPDAPPLFKRLANFGRAAIAHYFAGSPTCTQEQIDARLAVCRACDFYLPDNERPDIGLCCHVSCGCNASREDVYLNKLAWADQECPIAKWGKAG